MKLKRREFLKMGFAATLLPLMEKLSVPTSSQEQKPRYAMLVDVSKCFGCLACITACHSENNVPLGNFRTWVEKTVLKSGVPAFVPKLCNHCENPSCAKACPVSAIKRRDDGIIVIDQKECIGCGACIKACPYGAVFMDPVEGTANKCTFCSHRVDNGMLPACVETCPSGARIFGDLNDPNSAVNEVLKVKQATVLRPETGNDPQVYYVGLPKEGA